MENRKPRGVRWEENLAGFRVAATTFSLEFLFLLPFAAAFGYFSLGWLYGEQWTSQTFLPGRSLFGIPFLLGTAMVGWQGLMRVGGRVVVTSENDEVAVFEGLGPLGRTKRFRWSEVAEVKEGYLHDTVSTKTRTPAIRVTFREPKRPVVKFGSMLAEKRLRFVVDVMQRRVGRT
jgi:hypothetical protein